MSRLARILGGRVLGSPTPFNKIAQIVNSENGAVQTGTTAIPIDDTIPQNTEGDQYLSVAITPTNKNSTLVIDVLLSVSLALANDFTVALFQDATANALEAVRGYISAGTVVVTIPMKKTIVGGLVAGVATTFKVRAGPGGSGNMTVGGAASARLYGGVMISSITVTEILP